MELQVCGLDSISYLPHPIGSNSVLSVITDHACYTTLDEARVLADEFKSKWDTIDKINNFYAKKMLLSSLHPDLQMEVQHKITENDPFPIICLLFQQIRWSNYILPYIVNLLLLVCTVCTQQQN